MREQAGRRLVALRLIAEARPGRSCVHCGGKLAHSRRNALFCSSRCRSRASRRYRAGLGADAYPAGRCAGASPRTEKTRAEREAEVLSPAA